MFCPNVNCPDFVDTGIHGEYVDTIWACPVCGARLVSELRPEPRSKGAPEPEGSSREDVEGPLVPAASFLTRQDAELAVSFLSAQGIAATVSSDDAGGSYSGAGFGGGYRVLVPESQLEDATALLAQAETG